jgi:hypothetical protein
LSVRARKPAKTPPGNERAEVETMLRRLTELRRAASNSVLRGAYQAAIEGLDAVVYRLGMLRAVEPPGPARRPARVTASASAPPKTAAQIGVTRKPP